MMQTDLSDVLNNLKSLSDSTDLIIYQHTRENEQLDKWFSAIKETANAIINNSNLPKFSGANGSAVIPNLLSEIKGEKLQTKKRHRVSSFLAAAQKGHARLSHRKSRTSLRKIVLEKKNSNLWEISRSKPSDDQKSAKNSDCKSTTPNEVPKSSANISPIASAESIKTSVNNADENCYSTPQPYQTDVLVPNTDEKTPLTRSKTRDIVHIYPGPTVKKLRPNSSNKRYCTQELTPDIIQKKATNKCVTDAQTVKQDGDNSVAAGQKAKIKTDCVSTPPYETITLDSSDSEASSEKKPRTRSKRKSSMQLVQGKAKKTKNSSESQAIKHAKLLHEDNASGSKNCKAVRLNKNARNAVIQPKTSNTSQQIRAGSEKRILREIQKKEEAVSQNTKKLRSMRQMKIEESKKMREIKMEKAMQQRLKIESEKKAKMKCRTVSKQDNVQQKELSIKKTVPRKLQTEEKADSVKKVTPTSTQKMNLPTTLKALRDEKAASSTPKKAPPKPVRTPVQKAKLCADKQSTEQAETKLMDTTYSNPSVEASSKDVFTKPSPFNSTFVAKPVNITSTPAASKTVTKLCKTPILNLNKKNDSYTMTPSESSFISYDISEIKSDDSDGEESNNNKPVPSWATGIRLKNALFNQQYNPIDTAEIFGNYFETPDLTTIMGVEKKQYFKRTSSAIWINSPNRSLLY